MSLQGVCACQSKVLNPVVLLLSCDLGTWWIAA
jgi:hypothetical protein